MRPYVVRQGDYLIKLAARDGFDADSVWNHPKNQALRAERKNPNMLHPGDVLFLPDEKAEWHELRVGSENMFTANVPTVSVTASFLRSGRPLANAKCRIEGVGWNADATTDGGGKLALQVPVTTQFVTVSFQEVPLVRTLCVGHLDPIDKPSGALERLRNLRYLPAHVTIGLEDPSALARVVTSFQKANKLPATGELDAATLDALRKAHGS